jgi:hypothetical protein
MDAASAKALTVEAPKTFTAGLKPAKTLDRLHTITHAPAIRLKSVPILNLLKVKSISPLNNGERNGTRATGGTVSTCGTSLEMFRPNHTKNTF